MDAFWNNPIYPLLSTEISTWTEQKTLYKKNYNGILFTASNEYIWLLNLNFHAWIKKCHFGNFTESSPVFIFQSFYPVKCNLIFLKTCQQIQNKPESNNIIYHCLLHSSSRLEKAHLKFKAELVLKAAWLFYFPRSKQSKIDWILSALKDCEVSSEKKILVGGFLNSQ